MKRWSQSKNNTQLRICLVIEAKSNAKKQYCIGTLNVRSMNQDKLEVAKQEMTRVNINILGISELKWTGTAEFNLDNHYILATVGKNLLEEMEQPSVNKRV